MPALAGMPLAARTGEAPDDAVHLAGPPPLPGKRQRILAAASELIVRDGLQSPMSAIAEKSGVSMGSIYNHFAGKNELVMAIYDEIAAQANEHLVEPPNPDQTCQTRIMRYIHAYIDFFWQDPDRAILFEYLSNVPLIAPDELERVFGTSRTFINALLAEGQAAGLVKSCSTRFMAGLIGGGIRNALKWHRANHLELTDRQRQQIALLCWDAIAA
tara:strand:- start:47123 stop:47767 length:645 start_codon:yes stop_codon:yes gene_type:complete